MHEALEAAHARSVELGQEFGNDPELEEEDS